MDNITHISGSTSQYRGIFKHLGEGSRGFGRKAKEGSVQLPTLSSSARLKEQDVDSEVHPTAHSALNPSPCTPQPQPSPSHHGCSMWCWQPLHPPASLAVAPQCSVMKRSRTGFPPGSSSSPWPEPTVRAGRAGRRAALGHGAAGLKHRYFKRLGLQY